jgi:hypothetical protein
MPSLYSAPRFLLALDRVTRYELGWITQCPVFGCPELMDIRPGDDQWLFDPDCEHTHDDVVDYLRPAHDDMLLPHLRERRRRAYQALLLSTTPEVWAQLMRGNRVPRDQLNQEVADRMRERLDEHD